MSDNIETINVTIAVTKKQLRALGWKEGKKASSRDDVRELANFLFHHHLKGVVAEYRASKQPAIL